MVEIGGVQLSAVSSAKAKYPKILKNPEAQKICRAAHRGGNTHCSQAGIFSLQWVVELRLSERSPDERQRHPGRADQNPHVAFAHGGHPLTRWADLKNSRPSPNLVSMTRNRLPENTVPRRWLLQDAKARFSELVRRAASDGPQTVTVHGRDAVVVVDADQFRRLQGVRSGALLVEAMQASPHRTIDLAPKRRPMPVRKIEL
jgi:prevent-host-death family protein